MNVLFYQFLELISNFKNQTRCVPPSVLFTGSQMLGTGLTTCVSGGTSHRSQTVGRLLRRLQLRGLRPGPARDGPRGARTAAAVAAVTAGSPASRCRLPCGLPLLQRHGGVRRPAAAPGPVRNPARDAGGHRLGLRARGARDTQGWCVSLPVGEWGALGKRETPSAG